MRTPLALAVLLAVGGAGHGAPLPPPPATRDVALPADAIDHGGEAAPLFACADLAARDRAACGKLRTAIADARRTIATAELARGWDAARRAAFVRLVAAQGAYAKAVAATEPADGEAAARAESDAFLKTLRAVVQGPAVPEPRDLVALDVGLNASYAQALQTGGAAGPGPDRTELRRVERAWLAYRDAFAAFAATLAKPGAVQAVKAELTRRRAADLEAMLAD